MSGTGNDFIISNLLCSEKQSLLLQQLNVPTLSDAAIQLCDTESPWKGADGALFIVPSHHYDFKWEFFNRDGSSA